MERIQLDSRRVLPTDVKMLILEKSNKRCCHCGCYFDYKHKLTIDHVIPLSKGGETVIDNLVALCKDCNESKSNNVIQPKEYYKYLLPEEIEKLQKNQDAYYENYNWFTPQNFFRDDKVVITLPLACTDYKKKNKTPRKTSLERKFILEKASRKDLDEICDLLKVYNERIGINQTQEMIQEEVEDHFTYGVFYIIKNSSGNIILVMPLRLRSWYTKDGATGIVPYMNGFITKYQNRIYRVMADLVMDELIASLSSLPIKTKSKYGFGIFGVYANDKFAANVLTQDEKIFKKDDEDENGFVEMLISYKIDEYFYENSQKQRNVDEETAYALAFKKYLEKNGYKLSDMYSQNCL